MLKVFYEILADPKSEFTFPISVEKGFKEDIGSTNISVDDGLIMMVQLGKGFYTHPEIRGIYNLEITSFVHMLCEDLCQAVHDQ